MLRVSDRTFRNIALYALQIFSHVLIIDIGINNIIQEKTQLYFIKIVYTYYYYTIRKNDINILLTYYHEFNNEKLLPMII